MSTVALRVARLVVRLYPRRWRQRYAEEVLDVLNQHHVRIRTVLDLTVNAVAARLDPEYRHSIRARFVVRGAGVLVAVLGASYGLYAVIFHEETAFGVTGAHAVAYSADGRLVATVSGAV